MKDRISIGGPSDERAKPLILRKDEEVTAAKGRPDAAPTPAPPLAPNTHQPAVQARAGDRVETPQTPGFRMPAGLGEMPRGEQGSRKGEGSQDPPIAASLRELDRRLAEAGPRGLPSGSRQMGPLAFDPEGADFTAWINHFRVEVYNNWNIPKPAELGYRGHVDFEFTVERDGTTSSVRLLKGSGTLAFDRAAQNALVGSRQLPLPADYGPPRVTMQVSFFYNEGPSGS